MHPDQINLSTVLQEIDTDLNVNMNIAECNIIPGVELHHYPNSLWNYFCCMPFNIARLKEDYLSLQINLTDHFTPSVSGICENEMTNELQDLYNFPGYNLSELGMRRIYCDTDQIHVARHERLLLKVRWLTQSSRKRQLWARRSFFMKHLVFDRVQDLAQKLSWCKAPERHILNSRQCASGALVQYILRLPNSVIYTLIKIWVPRELFVHIFIKTDGCP